MQSSASEASPGSQQDVRSWLKSATEAVHEALHQQALLLAIQESRIDLTGYQQVLSSFLAAFTYVQQACTSARKQGLTDLPSVIDLDQHIALLQADLQYCYTQSTKSTKSANQQQSPIALTSNTITSLPPANLPSALAKFAAQAMWQHAQQRTLTPWLLGHYYALHGSRFGRSTLAKGTAHLFATPALAQTSAKTGRSYVTLKASAEACSWPTFCEILNKHVRTQTARHACRAGTTLAFKLIEALLNLNPITESSVNNCAEGATTI